jgi:hypothetical protein
LKVSFPTVLIDASPAFTVLFMLLYFAGTVHGPPAFCAIAMLAVTKIIAVQIIAASLIEFFILFLLIGYE